MAMRHLITGQNSCAPDGASSSNPLNAFANAVLGQSSKTQVSLHSLSSAGVVWSSEA
jgi:peroxin-5